MNTQNVSNMAQTVSNINAEAAAQKFALSGINTMGVCMALSSNEHPLIRLNGLVLAVAPKSEIKAISLVIALHGFVFAKNKKKALLQRAFSFGSTALIAGLMIQSSKPKEEVTTNA